MTAPPVVVIHNIFQAIVPLPELWRAHLLPYLELDPVPRARLRLASRRHREWDENFVTPEKWRRFYKRTNKVAEVASLIATLAFVGWDVVPPVWHSAAVDIPIDEDEKNEQEMNYLRLESAVINLTPAATVLPGNFGMRTFPGFHIGFWHDMDNGPETWASGGVKTWVEMPPLHRRGRKRAGSLTYLFFPFTLLPFLQVR